MSAAPERALTLRCGSEDLLGILHPVTGRASRAGVVVVVGGPQYRAGSHRQFTLMARALAAAGYPVLRFDYRGMGDSSGDARPFDQIDDDISCAIDAFMREVPGAGGVVLWGLCDAASACMMYGNRSDPRIRGWIVANPWVRSEASEAATYVRHYYLQRLLTRSFWRKLAGGGLNVVAAARGFLGAYWRGRHAAADTAGSFVERMHRGAQGAGVPVLLLMSDKDLVAREFDDLCRRDARWAAWRARTDVATRVLAGVDHTFSQPGAVATASGICIDWLAELPEGRA